MPAEHIVHVEELITQLTEPWQPIDVCTSNGQVGRAALFSGEYHWHKHDDADELFVVLSGRIVVQVRGGKDIVLSRGDTAVIPCGVEHCPRADEPSIVLMIEPEDLKSEGD